MKLIIFDQYCIIDCFINLVTFTFTLSYFVLFHFTIPYHFVFYRFFGFMFTSMILIEDDQYYSNNIQWIFDYLIQHSTFYSISHSRCGVIHATHSQKLWIAYVSNTQINRTCTRTYLFDHIHDDKKKLLEHLALPSPQENVPRKVVLHTADKLVFLCNSPLQIFLWSS